MSGLAGRNVVVIGASSGIGRAFAIRAARAGAHVLLTARREERLDEARAAAGDNASVFPVDVTDPDACARLADEARRVLGSIDVVLSTVGVAPLRRIEETTAADWAATIQTNVVGFNSVMSALLPVLSDGALVLALSSEIVDMPRWAMAAYGVSKAALEASMRHWRVEHPGTRFGVVRVGATVPTEFGDDFEMELLTTSLDVWTRHGQAQASFMDTDEVADALAGIVAAVVPFPGIGMEEVVLRTPAPVVGSAELMKDVSRARDVP